MKRFARIERNGAKCSCGRASHHINIVIKLWAVHELIAASLKSDVLQSVA